MIIGSTIMHDGTGTTPYYTPSFPRGGEAAVFSLDVTHWGATGALTLVVTVEHKNSDETAWAPAGTFTNITAAGVSTKDLNTLKEEIRIAFTYTVGALGDFSHVVISAPAWRPY